MDSAIRPDVFVQWQGRSGPTKSHASHGTRTRCGLPVPRLLTPGVTHSTRPTRPTCRRCFHR